MTKKDEVAALTEFLSWLLPGQLIEQLTGTPEYKKFSVKEKYEYLQGFYLAVVMPNKEMADRSVLEHMFFTHYAAEHKLSYDVGKEFPTSLFDDVEFEDDDEGGDDEGDLLVEDETLAELLDEYVKEGVVEIARDKGWMIPQTLRKKEFIKELAAKMLASRELKKVLLWLPADEMLRVTEALEVPGHEKWLAAHATQETEFFVSGFLEMQGYAARDEHGIWLPSDVATAIEKELKKKNFWPQYEQYLWLMDTMRLTVTYYEYVPRSVFFKVLARWQGFTLSERQVKTAIDAMPLDGVRYVLENKYLRSAQAKPSEENTQLGEVEEGYLPTEQEVWQFLAIGQKAAQHLEKEEQKLLGKWGDEYEYYLNLALYLLLQREVLGLTEKDTTFQRAIGQALGELGPDGQEVPESERTAGQRERAADVRKALRRLAPHVRRRAHRGFTDAEMKRRQKGPQANVVSLADLRKKKEQE